MDCRKTYGFLTLLLIFVPLISAKCAFEEAETCLHKVQFKFDQFKTDLLNKTYIPKPSAKARICGNMEKNSTEWTCFYNSLKSCTKQVQESLQREWDALKEDHDMRCNAGSHIQSLLFVLLLVWTIIPLFD